MLAEDYVVSIRHSSFRLACLIWISHDSCSKITGARKDKMEKIVKDS